MVKARDAHQGADPGAAGTGALRPILSEGSTLGSVSHPEGDKRQQPDGGFAERAQEPGCWVRRARGDSESEHRMGDKLLSLGKSRQGDTLSICYTPASSSPRDPVSKASNKSPHH